MPPIFNETLRHIYGESGCYETFADTPGELFKALQREYGRCVSKVYIGEKTPVGWVFEKRAEYEDTGEPYIQEVWVTMHREPPTVTRTPHYLTQGGE